MPDEMSAEKDATEGRYEPVVLYRCQECCALGDVGYVRAHDEHHDALRSRYLSSEKVSN